MNDFVIDPQLIEMLRTRRVIPFIGAGFSASLDMPDWETLLSKIAGEVEGTPPYKTVASCCSNDPLQIAEYYLLMSDGNIGPIRYAIERALNVEKSPVLSAAHVELVNTGAPFIYTTNFDDLIETTFRDLNLPFEVVALPKDVATASEGKTQIIKYHGDLRHESTLVLTESSYYSRLDFESPMDLKFRSDLLGRSVLFMGYSFRDINIRVIWFKLMQMMKDIPIEDRPTSYITRLEPNPILERLYESVGIKSIVIDPQKKAKTNAEKARLLGAFMLVLSSQISDEGIIPGTKEYQFVSQALIDAMSGHNWRIRRRFVGEPSGFDRLLTMLEKRQVPPPLAPACRSFLDEIALHDSPLRFPPPLIKFAAKYITQFGSSPGATIIISLALTNQTNRKLVFSIDMPWEKVWASRLNPNQATPILNLYKEAFEFGFVSSYEELENLAYLTDVVLRIANGELVRKEERKIRHEAGKLIQIAYKAYPSLKKHKPSSGAPNLKPMLKDLVKDAHLRRGRLIKP